MITSTRRGHRATAFTLIELLVVIAIIAILAAILFRSSLRLAIRRARPAVFRTTSSMVSG